MFDNNWKAGQTAPVITPRFPRWSTAFLRAALLALLAGLSACKPAARPERPVVVRVVRVAPPTPADAAGGAQYVGILRGHLETDLGFKVDGTLERIGPAEGGSDWREGTPIRKGQPLAKLVPRDFEAAVADANSRLVLSESVLNRTRDLFASQMVSQQELDTAIANRASATAALERAKQALADSQIVAPYDGVIVARLARAGETIMALANRPVLRVADQTRMEIELGLPDKRIGRIAPGLAVPVRVSAYEGLSFTGRVTEVGVSAKPGTRLFSVITELPNAEGKLKAGMSATVDFSNAGAPPNGAVRVPLSALLARAATNGSTELLVFVVEAGRARERRVETGDILGSSILVTEGLRPGEVVVSAGAGLLHEGAPVDARFAAAP